MLGLAIGITIQTLLLQINLTGQADLVPGPYPTVVGNNTAICSQKEILPVSKMGFLPVVSLAYIQPAHSM